MHRIDLVERYRSYAAKCIKISRNVTDPAGKFVLLEMAQAWLKLAERSIESTTLVDQAAVTNAAQSD